MTNTYVVKLSRRAALLGLAVLGASAGTALALVSGFTAYSKGAFDAALKGPKPVLVHVHADWCPVCVKQEKVFNELSKTPEFGKLAAFKVDFDRDPDFRKAYGVNNQSIILVFRGGKEVARSGGVTDRTKIAEFVAAAVK